MSTTDLSHAMTRIQKSFDVLQARYARVVDENARLKQQVAESRASKSRVRRIPKKSAAAAPADTEEQTPGEATA